MVDTILPRAAPVAPKRVFHDVRTCTRHTSELHCMRRVKRKTDWLLGLRLLPTLDSLTLDTASPRHLQGLGDINPITFCYLQQQYDYSCLLDKS